MVTSSLHVDVLLGLLNDHPGPILFYVPVLSATGEVEDFELAYCNKAAVSQTRSDELIGQRVLTYNDSTTDIQRKIFSQLLHVFTTGEAVEDHYYNPVLEQYFAVTRKASNGGVLTLSRDVSAEVSERLEKERQTELASQVLKSSLHSWFACEVVRDAKDRIVDFIITRINPEFTRQLGLSESEVVGQSYLTLFPSALENGAYDLNCRVMETGVSERMELHHASEGREAWYEAGVSRLDHENFLVTFADITPYKNAIAEIESKTALLNSIMHYSVNGISVSQVLRNEAGQVVDARTIIANEAAVRYIGLPREIYLNKTAVEIEPNIASSPYFLACMRTLETGEPTYSQYQLESTGNWLELSISRMDEDHLITVFTDITAGKVAEQEKERLLQDLRRSNESLEEFTRVAAHDLKEPVRKVKFFGDLLTQRIGGRLDPEEARILERMDGAIDRMHYLIDDLLDYSRLHRNDRDPEAVDLNDKLRLIVSDLEMLVRESGARIEVDEMPVVRGFRRQLQQLFQNLLANALNYRRAGVTPTVSVQGRTVRGGDTGRVPAEEAERAFHLIEVRDNGIGFEQADADRIFQVFTRLHGNQEYPGTGIGLSIARKVVENHRGYIWAEGEVDRGASFFILLSVE